MQHTNVNGFRFRVNTPSLNTWHKDGDVWDSYSTWGSFNDFFDSFFRNLYSGRYVKISNMVYAGEGGYDSNGDFICKIVEVTRPDLTFEFSFWSKNLKSFHYKPGKIILELPNGETLPVFSDAEVVEKEGSKYDIIYHISQPYTRRFLEVCNHHKLPWGKDTKYMSFSVYKENDNESLARDMQRIKREQEEAATRLRSTASAAQEEKPTNSEIENLWRTTK